MPVPVTHSLDLETASDQEATRADTAVLDLTTALTIEGWFKPETVGSRYLVTKYDADTSTARSYAFQTSAGTSLELYIQDTGGGAATASVSYTGVNGVWVHLAVTWESASGDTKFYVNGSQQGATQTLQTGDTIRNTATNFSIGGAKDDNSGFYDGLIHDVRLWNVVRTQPQINGNKTNCDLDVASSGLVGWWPFNNDYTDKTANALTLTAVNAPVFVSGAANVPYQCGGGGLLLCQAF